MKLSPTFRRALTEVADGNVLLPILRGELYSPDFSGFTLEVEPWTDREPDGWFHPSEHATWHPRQLALLLMHPELVERERKQLSSVLAITQGKFWHQFIQKVLGDHGILVEAEFSAEDPAHRRRGHLDGILDGPPCGREGFEFKTMAPELIRKITTVADLREVKPTYYAQAQDYLDMTGLTTMRMVILSPAYPFPMVELAIGADEVFQQAQRRKYTQALTAVAEGTLPQACCTPRSAQAKQCPVRMACPIGTR